MKIECIWEHNGDDTILYAKDYVGAFTRGENLEVASKKMKNERNYDYDEEESF